MGKNKNMTKTKKIILIVLLIMVVVVVGWYGLKKYEQWSFWREMRSQADQFTFEQNRLKALVEADTYGGKTPQETLELFIKAVEAGDYELASKYFVVEKQGKWLDNLSSVENINEFLQVIIQAKNLAGDYSENKMTYSIHGQILLDFIKYPSNLWKINEI